jgi:hypothetical protein
MWNRAGVGNEPSLNIDRKANKFMKLSIPILLALTLLLAAVSFARAEAVSAAGETALTTTNAPAYQASAITTTGVITTADLTGVIVYGPGTDLPEALPVTLYAYQPSQAAMDLILTSTTTSPPGGAFSFENVASPEGGVFMTSVTYAGVPYHSTPSMGEPMTITVFETTTTTNHLLADQLHLIFDFSDPGNLQVMEVYILTNVGAQTVVAGKGGQFMLDFPLPEGAQNIDFRSGLVGEAELETNDGFWDISAVRPGGMYGVSYAFSLPYPGKITLNQPIELPVSSVGVLLPVLGTLKIESAGLVDSGISDFGGASYHVYAGENLRAGSQLGVKITGDPNASASGAAAGGSGSRLGLIIGLGAFGLALVLAGVWINRRNRLNVTENDVEMLEGEESGVDEDETDVPADSETLMDDIIALDDLYQAGELPETAYRERRAELKEKLRAIIGDKE